MSLPDAILQLENRHIGPDGEPTLGNALLLAIKEWRSGNRDRELRLHLLYLSWYCNLEPSHITGLDEDLSPLLILDSLFHNVYETFAANIQNDVESLFVIGIIAGISPWLLGEDIPTWDARRETFRLRTRELLPEGLYPTHFEGRGAYGEYFASQAAVIGGF